MFPTTNTLDWDIDYSPKSMSMASLDVARCYIDTIRSQKDMSPKKCYFPIWKNLRESYVYMVAFKLSLKSV